MSKRPAIDLDALIGPEEDYQRIPAEDRVAPVEDDVLRALDDTYPVTVGNLAGLTGLGTDAIAAELQALSRRGHVEATASGGWVRTPEGDGAIRGRLDPNELQAC